MSTESPCNLPFELNEEATKAWLSGLSASNPRESCRVLYAGLQALNSASPDPGLHLLVLDQLRQRIFVESEKLEPFFFGKPFPLDDKARKLAKLTALFHAELAQGYDAVARSSGFSETFTSPQRASVLSRALRSFEIYLYRSALMYETTSSQTWEKLNRLYRVAEQDNLTAWVDPTEEDEPVSIATIFLRLQIFRLVVPNHLTQINIQRLHQVLSRFGRLLTWTEGGSEAEADFVVDLDSSRSPLPCALAGKSRESSRRFSPRLFLAKLDKLSQPTASKQERLDGAFVAQLQARLGGALPFSQDQQKTRNAVLILGLEPIFTAVAQIQLKGSLQPAWSSAPEMELLPLSDHLGAAPAMDLSKSQGTFIATAAGNRSAQSKPAGDGRIDSLGEHRCRVYPSEAPGFYLLETPKSVLQSGGLIGLNTDNKLIQIGLVFDYSHGGGKRFGFELLLGNAEVVRVACKASPDIAYKALLDVADKSRSALIIQAMKLRNGEEIVIDRQGQKLPYRIAKLLESTPEFSHFEIVLEQAQESS